MNSALILALLWSTDYLLRGGKLRHRVLACAYVLTVPFAANAVVEFRPDFLWGLAAAMAIILPLRTSMLAASNRYLLACGVWCAIALLAKPATSPLTLFTVGLAWLLAVVCAYLDSDRTLSFERSARILAVCALPAFLLAGPHYLVDCRGIYNYIVINSFGPHKNLWHRPGGWTFQAGYFFIYDGGKFMLGAQAWVLVAITIGGFLMVIGDRKIRGDRFRRAVCLGIVTVACYVFIAINPHKNPYFGAEFAALMVLGCVVVLRMLVTNLTGRLPGRWANWAIVAVMIAGLIGWRFPPALTIPGSEFTAQSNATVRSISACVFDNIPLRGGVFVTGFGWVNSGAISYLVRQRGKIVASADFHRENDLQFCRRALDDADVVVAAQSGVAEFRTELPSYDVLDQTLAMTRARPDLRQVGAVRSRTGKFFFVFARAATFGGWDGIAGLAALEDSGAIPDRRFRWGLDPGVIIRVSSAVAVRRQLSVNVRAPMDGQEILFTLYGKEVDRHTFAAKNVFESIHLELGLSVGDREIELHFKKSLPKSTLEGHPKAVQFQELRLIAAGDSVP